MPLISSNKGEIITYGVNALGMYGNGAKVTNSGIITVTGTNAEAVIPRHNGYTLRRLRYDRYRRCI